MGVLGAVPVIAVVVLGVEVMAAVKAPQLPASSPYVLSRSTNQVGAGRVVWLGDSTAAGVGASSEATTLPLMVLAAGVGGRLDALAVSGARVDDVLRAQLPLIETGPVGRVFISVGANDVTGLTSRGDFRRRYRALLNALPKGVQVVTLGVPDMGAAPRLAQPLRSLAGLRGRQLNEIVREEGAKSGALYVDIAGETGPEMRRHSDRYFAGDKYHPSDRGYALWSAAVVKATTAAGWR